MKPSALVAMMLAMGVGAPQAGMGTRSQQVSTINRDAIAEKVTPAASMLKNIMEGSGERAGHPANRFLNQRQYRKRCRQNPHLYKSAKHRSKN